ncbi:unnamed protein product [Hymenolepis diminuta]|uniref:Uncharacterized protein n=1 Tax=Hymenolepis diminuta TaxID=6216 RepID=A0A564YLD1_HYMDI|nr:unnamed protein product [Hymenolepis diminuta]
MDLATGQFSSLPDMIKARCFPVCVETEKEILSLALGSFETLRTAFRMKFSRLLQEEVVASATHD